MAAPPGTLRVGRYFLALIALLAALYALIVFPGQRHSPKLGIDLVGGLRVQFTAQTPKGAPPPTSAQMSQARQILEDRINTTGVTGSTVVVQGSDQLVVEIPNGTGADVARLGEAAVLNFRGLIAPGQIVTCVPSNSKAYKTADPPALTVPTASTSPTSTPTSSSSSHSSAPSSPAKKSATQSPHGAYERPLTKPKPSNKPSAKSTKAGSTPKTSPSSSPSPTSSSSAAAKPTRCSANPLAVLFKKDPSLKKAMPNAESCPSPAIKNNKLCKAWTSLSATQQGEINEALTNFDCPAAQSELDDAKHPSYYIACDDGSLIGAPAAYLLGTVIVPGKHIDSANAQAPDLTGNGGSTTWTVSLNLDSTGGDSWFAWTKKYNTTSSTSVPVQTTTTPPCGSSASVPCSDWVGFTLDGRVISIPVTEAALDRQTSISGGFNQSSAEQLAQELNYGKLPITFREPPDRIDSVSATLGTSQLHAAFLAGGIGLILVILYSLIYYRALGLVTIASLIVSASLTYVLLVILGTQIGFTLDLAGIAGFIVALGITADSFVVFFERIKDEVHDGRSMRVAVPRAWVRARRTILSADTVSFLAAAILYYFASADVKGFAFTLGMSTILDLIVVFLFTHPMVSLCSRSRAFGSARFTGLSSVRTPGMAILDEDESPRRPRRTRPARAGRATTQTAVVEPDVEVVADDADAEPATEPVGELPEPTGPRRRTTPEPGTAAERAAARRARMRKDSGGKDTGKGGEG